MLQPTTRELQVLGLLRPARNTMGNMPKQWCGTKGAPAKCMTDLVSLPRQLATDAELMHATVLWSV